MEYTRKNYLEWLEHKRENHFIKILIGIRRSGKSTILRQFANTLTDVNIIEYDFNDLELQSLTYIELHREIIKKANPHKTNYLFLDEIQEIKEWEKCVISLYENRKIKFDIYITGSNAKLLSTELSTLLTGRHLDLSVLPLTFKEFSELSEAKNYLENLDKYIAIGGLGVVIPNINRTEDAKLSLKGVLEDTINKDIKHRHKNTSNILINKVIEYAFNNVGVEISTVKLESYFKKTEKNYATYKTLNNYLQWAVDAMLLYRVSFFNTKTKTILKTSCKYYAGDLGLLNANINDNRSMFGYQLENLVLLQLLSEGYKVYTAEIYQKNKDNKGIDFVAIKDGIIKYIQVTYELNEQNLKRESDNLLLIKDAYEKIVVFVYAKVHPLNNGIKLINLFEWLMGEQNI